jgi:hypothetical protein
MEKLYQNIIPGAKKPITDRKELATLINKLEGIETTTSSDRQISLDIKVKKESDLKKAQKRTRNWVRIAHINPYWKNASAVAMVITSLVSSGILLTLLLKFYPSLPSQIPAIYNQALKSWTYIAKEDAIIVPIAHLVLTLIFLRLNMVIFKFDRRLVLTLNNSLILFNVVYLIEIFQIFTMLKIY